ncbi:MAG: MbnP family protein [Bacteroidia bacterium]|nr:MbnP family protein [Bacteroidia bacterium]
MNMLSSLIRLSAVIAVASMTACDVSKPDPDKTGMITLEFDNVVGDKDLILDTDTYTNVAGETFSVTTLNYFVSNIRLKKADGTYYTYPQDQSYFLVKEADDATHGIELEVPEDDYTGMEFILGVDSLRSTADVSQRTGVLDPATNGMYWSWNSGYIFMMLEGISPQAPADPTGVNSFQYHTGGFGGYSSVTINNIKKITLDFNGEEALVRGKSHPEVHIYADLLKFFDGPNADVSIAEHPVVHFNAYSTTLSENYSRMFTVDHVHNE